MTGPTILMAASRSSRDWSPSPRQEKLSLFPTSSCVTSTRPLVLMIQRASVSHPDTFCTDPDPDASKESQIQRHDTILKKFTFMYR